MTDPINTETLAPSTEELIEHLQQQIDHVLGLAERVDALETGLHELRKLVFLMDDQGHEHVRLTKDLAEELSKITNTLALIRGV